MKTRTSLLNNPWVAATVALVLVTAPASSQVIPGGDFQLYKPGSTTVTAAITNGWGVVWSGATPTNMVVQNAPSALLTYSDTTTGTTADLLQWTKTRGGANIGPNGPGGSLALIAYATWGGHTQIETVGSLHTVASGQAITISAQVGGGATGPIAGDLTLALYANGTLVTPTSSINAPQPTGGTFHTISRTYNTAALASHIGASTKIVVGCELTNQIPNAVFFDDVSLVASAADTTPPTVTSFEHNKGSGPIVINEPVTYTVTFSEPLIASSVNISDFANNSLTPITVSSVTPTANPAVFTVGVTPTAAGTLQLRIASGASLTDYQANSLNAGTATPDDSTLVVNTPVLISTTTGLISSGSSTTYGQNVTFTATVSPAPSGGTIQFRDDGNPLGSQVTVNTSTGVATFSTTNLNAGNHGITADYSGNFQYAASSTAAPLSHQVSQAQLTVRATNAVRRPNTANPSPLNYQITGYQNGQNFATSGVTGAPALSTSALIESPIGTYTITCALGDLASSNYSFALANGTLTVKELANTFSLNFYVGPDWPYGGLTTDEQKANVRLEPTLPAGMGDWFTAGWQNFLVPWGLTAPMAPVTLTSNQGSTAQFTLKDCRNGWTYNGPRTTLLGDGNGNLMDAHVNSTLEGASNKFDMQVSNIPFARYDVIFYIGASLAQFGDGTGVIKFNGGADRAFKVKPGAFDGTFTEMVDATTLGNYIVFPSVTGSSFTTQTWGTGTVGGVPGYVHLGPFGFQIREAAAGYTAWANTNAPGQTASQDHDNDGVENGIEYFMGQTGSSFTTMPVLNGSNLISWPMAPAYSGTYEVQTSPDLVNWTNVDPRPAPSGGNLSYTLPSGLGKRFVRLLATPTN